MQVYSKLKFLTTTSKQWRKVNKNLSGETSPENKQANSSNISAFRDIFGAKCALYFLRQRVA